MEEKSYPWPSVPSMLILVPFLFPKYLLGPYRVPSTYFQAALCTCIKMCRNHCTRPICFTGQHPPSPKSPVPRSREAGPLVSHSPGLRSLCLTAQGSDLWRTSGKKPGHYWPSTGSTAGGLLLLFVPRHHMTLSPPASWAVH